MGESLHEFGMNWSDSYTYFLQDLGKTIAIRFDDGHIEYYPRVSDSTFGKPDGLAKEKFLRHLYANCRWSGAI